MPVPTYDQFIEPILRTLAANPDGMPARAVHESAALALELTENDKLELLSSGAQPVYKNRAGWAHDRLKRAGYSASSRRGYWKLTDAGLVFAQTHAPGLDGNVLKDIATSHLDVRLKPDTCDVGSASPGMTHEPGIALTSPDDRLSDAVEELRQAAEHELLAALGQVSPSYFETIVLDLLHRMGYGASRADLQRVGGSGDGGIDGVIALDRLGLEKVYVQAKRWQGSVGRPELQAFYGALAGQKAKKGVFMTTSVFTAQATEFARSVEGIVLVDGTKLAALMMEYELGVTSRTVRIPKLDSDYFDEESI